LIGATTAGKWTLANLSATDPKVVVHHRLPGHLGQLEANRPTCLALPDVGSINRIAVGCHVVDAESHEIAPAQLLSIARLKAPDLAIAVPVAPSKATLPVACLSWQLLLR
jgi:hypothetical protein